MRHGTVFPMASETERLFPGKFFISTALEALETKTAMSGNSPCGTSSEPPWPAS